MSLLLLFNQAAVVPTFLVMKLAFSGKPADIAFEAEKSDLAFTVEKANITFTKVDC